MKRLLFLQTLVAALSLALVGLVMLGGALGNSRASPLQTNANCRLPCWQGIHPGETTLSAATDTMIDLGYQPEFEAEHNHYNLPTGIDGCTVTMYWFAKNVSQMQLNNCPDLRLGDLILKLGKPDQIAPNLYTLDFDHGRVRAQIRPLHCGEHLTPHTSVQFLTLTYTESPQSTTAIWRGFASPWRYRQSMPNVVILSC